MLPIPHRTLSAPGALGSIGEARLRRLEAIAKFLDGALRVPGTPIRFGADALLNLAPGVGTVASTGLSAYLIWEARRMGVPLSILLRMLGNVALDFAISAVPVAGWLGDVFFRANLRNVALLRGHLGRAQTGKAPRYAQPAYR